MISKCCWGLMANFNSGLRCEQRLAATANSALCFGDVIAGAPLVLVVLGTEDEIASACGDHKWMARLMRQLAALVGEGEWEE